MDTDTMETTERRAAAAEARKARRAHELAVLLSERPDLSGTYAPADWAVDAVRWSA
ncbi:MAG TPA: hypothetical protein VFN47_14470 [Pedococcus sp.]|nr:hypothetical protein [Pedococcus sp.]